MQRAAAALSQQLCSAGSALLWVALLLRAAPALGGGTARRLSACGAAGEDTGPAPEVDAREQDQKSSCLPH